MLPEYKIKSIDTGFIIERPDRSRVNGCVWKERAGAEKWLSILKAMKYCK